ncbi:MAG TPA: hypothetical protein PKC21_01505 [Oligoflexia bacterium]|nr:hypothetical protein [Oligoflexia bacterium]HMR24007.1 hypothetical protein [Oligoflexia bacterium]
MKIIFYTGFMGLFLLLPLSLKAQNVEDFIHESVEFQQLLNEIDQNILPKQFEVESLTEKLREQMDQLIPIYIDQGREINTIVEQGLHSLHETMGWPGSHLFRMMFINYALDNSTISVNQVTFEKKDGNYINIYIFHQLSKYSEEYTFYGSVPTDDEEKHMYVINFDTSFPYNWNSYYYSNIIGSYRKTDHKDPLFGCETLGIHKAATAAICNLMRSITSN